VRDGAAKSGKFVEAARRSRRCSRVARQEQPVVADQRKLLALRVGQSREEMEKIARQNRDFQDTYESAVMSEPLAN
jgi:hypothetical protein